MAHAHANRPVQNDGKDWGSTQKRRRLQELFRGRFTEKQSWELLSYHEFDLERTASFLLHAESHDIQDILGNTTNNVTHVREDEVLRDLVTKNEVEHEVRQYACDDCDNVWWRRVSVRKPISRCKKCKQKFDPIPRHQEYGWSRFTCDCGNEFHGFGDRGSDASSACYKCRRDCLPDKVFPPTPRRMKNDGNIHSCTAGNCFNRKPPALYEQVDGECIHPKSTSRRVQTPSTRHVSTGSTVLTFLDQDDVPGSQYEPSLMGIPE